MIERNFIPSKENVNFNVDYHFDSLDCFKVCPLNRPSGYNDKSVKDYAKQMMNYKWRFDLSPIYVGITDYEILNGENRRKAITIAKENGTVIKDIRVRFVDDSTFEKKKECIDILNGGKHWNSDDYVNAQISEGNKNFIFLRDFCADEDHPKLHSKNKLNYNKGGVLLCGSYKKFKEGYKTGNWFLSKKDKDMAEQRYNQIVRIRKCLNYDTTGNDCWQYIAEAWYMITNDINWYNKIKNLPEGVESFYNELKDYENTLPSNKPSEWYSRFTSCIDRAYNKQLGLK